MKTQNQLVKASAEVIDAVPGCSFHQTALVIDRKITFEEVEKLYAKIRAMKGAVLWWMGDLICYCEGWFPERYSQIFDPTDYDIETIRGAYWVCSRVPILHRHSDVPYCTYKLIAKYQGAEQERLIDKIRSKKMTVREVERMLSVKKAKDNAAFNAVPVQFMGFCSEFYAKAKAALDEMPLEKWESKALNLSETTFKSMVHETMKMYGWKTD